MKRADVQTCREDEVPHIRAFVLKHIHERPKGLAMFFMSNIDVQPDSSCKEIQRMVKEGLLHAEGKTSNRRYSITERGAELRDRPSLSRRLFPSWQEFDAELLTRGPCTKPNDECG